MKSKLLFFCFLLGFSGCLAGGPTLPVIGLDENGNPVEMDVHSETLSQWLGDRKSDVHQELSFALERSETQGKVWKLKQVDFGIVWQEVWGLEMR